MKVVGMVLHGRYEIITELGKGGMSNVYLAKDIKLESYWAVKHIKINSNVDISVFKREVELLSNLNYSDIPRIVDRIEVNEDYFVVMDFIDGTSLRKKVINEGPILETSVVEWAKMLCDVLHYLHNVRQYPIIYRDLKPENIMMTQSGRIKLIDFGIAKECRPGEKQVGGSIGTRGYAAPEQYEGSSNILDERTDIYSLGATLYYLVTGQIPDTPPDAIRPFRQMNQALTEGLEYIILKCTRDNPSERYQNCMEMREDLDRIEQLTGSYRRKMVRKLSLCVASLVATLIFSVISYRGYSGMQAEQEECFQTAFQEATRFDRKEEYDLAARRYAEAIALKPSDYDTYLLLFNALLPHDKDDNNKMQTKCAIDEMRKRYIENRHSDMYHNPGIMLQLVKRCIEVQDPIYAGYALEYIDWIKKKDYMSSSMQEENLESFEVIALNCAKNITTQDFDSFHNALISLEKNTDNTELSANEKLENYYSIILMYHTYSEYLKNSSFQITQIGIKAKDIIDHNMLSEELTFNNIVPMYELIASATYNFGISRSVIKEKQELFQESIKWFEYLEILEDNLEEILELKKGNAYKGLYELSNKTDKSGEIDARTSSYLDESIKVYQNIIRKNKNSFLAHVYLAQAYLDKEHLKPAKMRDYRTVQSYYNKAQAFKNGSLKLSSIELAQFGSLKKQIQLAGLELR